MTPEEYDALNGLYVFIKNLPPEILGPDRGWLRLLLENADGVLRKTVPQFGREVHAPRALRLSDGLDPSDPFYTDPSPKAPPDEDLMPPPEKDPEPGSPGTLSGPKIELALLPKKHPGWTVSVTNEELKALIDEIADVRVYSHLIGRFFSRVYPQMDRLQDDLLAARSHGCERPKQEEGG